MQYAIETENLSHRFSKGETVLNQISIRVPAGSIYGFLGPNGAGKTTTLRLILGLLKKQDGHISVLGKSFDDSRIEILNQVGSLIESPSLYGHLTARENLKVLQLIYQCPEERIEKVLELVGLSQTGNKKVNQFSLGMKQRLSIAIALLHSPSLLILDEPTNGLDPNGILEMRELLRRINTEEKITILISSHLLSEIEKLVTHIGIINKGQLIFQGSLNELMQKQQESSFTRIQTSDNSKALSLLLTNNFQVKSYGNFLSGHFSSNEEIAVAGRLLINGGIDLYEISPVKNDLESVFMNLTNL